MNYLDAMSHCSIHKADIKAAKAPKQRFLNNSIYSTPWCVFLSVRMVMLLATEGVDSFLDPEGLAVMLGA